MAILTQTDNPILWQEVTHQERSASRWMHWSQIGGITGVIVILLVIPWLLFSTDNGYPVTQYALYATWIVHTVVAVRAIVAGANAISREHVGQTWDALTLTGVSARRILFGKWRAALRRVRGWMLMLGVVRLVMLPVFTMAMLKTYAWYMCGGYNSGYNSARYYCQLDSDFALVPWAIVLAVVMTVALTILDVLACTALGLAASAITRRGTVAGLAAILIRFTPVLLFGSMTRYAIGVFSWRWWLFTPFALADGGTSPLMQLVMPVIPWTNGRHVYALSGLGLSALSIVIFLVVSFVAALVAIRRTGALPQAKRRTAA